MRVFSLIGVSIVIVVLMAGCGSIRSGLNIEPGATFVLGGDQRGAFRVEALNTSPARVSVSEITVSGDTLAVADLPPGETRRARFAAGSAALLINRDTLNASLDVRITGDTNLGMRYLEERD